MDQEKLMLKEIIFQAFRIVDKDDLGMVSHEECIEVFKNIGLGLTRF